MQFRHELIDFQRIKQINSPAGRVYETPSGLKYPSVTAVLGAMKDQTGLNEWKNRVGYAEANKIMRRAGSQGTEMHRICENYMLNRDPGLGTNFVANEQFQNIKGILDEHVTTVYGVEFPVYSHKLKTAGTADFFCDWDGKKTVLDFKTSIKTKREEWIEDYFIQATVYAMCLWEIYGIKVEQIAVLISVEHDQPQLFVKDPLDYIQRAVEKFRDYHAGIRP